MTMQGYTKIDYDLAIIVLRLGGRQLLHALQQRLGITSHASIKLQDRPPFLVSHKGFSPQHASSNSASMFNQSQQESRPCVLMIDELAIEPTVRYDPTTNQLAAVCWQHSSSSGVDLTVDTPDRIDGLRDMIRGEGASMHLASEASVVAVGKLSNSDYNARAVLALPHCKSGSASDQYQLLSSILSWWWQKGGPHEKYGPLMCVS
jgi:hypothetical protein